MTRQHRSLPRLSPIALTLCLAATLATTLASAQAASLTTPTVATDSLPAVAAGGGVGTNVDAVTSITQVLATNGTQTALVGGTQNVRVLGELVTHATLRGSLTQTQTAAGAGVLQTINVAGGSGVLGARRVETNGSLRTSVTQQQDGRIGAGSDGGQTVAVGSAHNVQGGEVTTRGDLGGTPAGVVQSRSHTLAQTIAVGSVADSTLQNGSTDGQLQSAVSQTQQSSLGGGAEQSIAVAQIRDTTATTVNASGRVFSTADRASGLVQAQTGVANVLQTVDVGSVSDVAAGNTLITSGEFSGTLTQQANGRRSGSGSQQVALASISGGNLQRGKAQGGVFGGITQTQTDLAEQRVSVGSILNSAGTVTTNGQVSGQITQTATPSASGSGRHQQLVSVAEVIGSGGNVFTSAAVHGNLSQATGTAVAAVQRIEIGTVRNAGTARVIANISVEGDIAQTAERGANGQQNVLIGNVGR